MVHDEPYCVWEIDLLERNTEFLGGIDEEYFDYLLEVHGEAEDEKRAAIALRAGLHHAMETMFALLGSYIQAPDCSYAWVAKCSNGALRKLVGDIGKLENRVFTKLNLGQVSWGSVADSVFKSYMPGTEKNERTVNSFSLLWKRLAREFTDKNCIDEYNSIKHGFRIRSGGFSLAVGIENEYGVPAESKRMTLLGKSEYGSTFYRIEPVGEGKRNRSVRSRQVSINWRIEKTILLLQLVSMSIKNITSALKIANGAEGGTCRFIRPKEDSDFEKPWTYSPGVSSCNIDRIIDERQVVAATKSELMEIINNSKEG